MVRQLEKIRGDDKRLVVARRIRMGLKTELMKVCRILNQTGFSGEFLACNAGIQGFVSMLLEF